MLYFMCLIFFSSMPPVTRWARHILWSPHYTFSKIWICNIQHTPNIHISGKVLIFNLFHKFFLMYSFYWVFRCIACKSTGGKVLPKQLVTKSCLQICPSNWCCHKAPSLQTRCRRSSWNFSLPKIYRIVDSQIALPTLGFWNSIISNEVEEKTHFRFSLFNAQQQQLKPSSACLTKKQSEKKV